MRWEQKHTWCPKRARRCRCGRRLRKRTARLVDLAYEWNCPLCHRLNNGALRRKWRALRGQTPFKGLIFLPARA